MNTTDKVTGIFVGAILAAALIPVGLQSIAGGITCVNQSLYGGCNWTGTDTIATGSEFALYGVISIAVIVAVVVGFFKFVK